MANWWGLPISVHPLVSITLPSPSISWFGKVRGGQRGRESGGEAELECTRLEQVLVLHGALGMMPQESGLGPALNHMSGYIEISLSQFRGFISTT